VRRKVMRRALRMVIQNKEGKRTTRIRPGWPEEIMKVSLKARNPIMQP